MQKLIYPLIVALFFCGCVSTGIKYSKKDPSEFHALKWKTGAIDISGKKISETEFLVIAKGAGICTEEQVKEAWLEIAEELGAGRAIETELEVKDYNYSASGGIVTTRHSGKMISGKVLILEKDLE